VLISVTKRNFDSKSKEKVLWFMEKVQKKEMGNKLNVRNISKKNKKVHKFLERNDFCSFNHFEKLLKEAENQKTIATTFNFQF
jgi:hypothetical protein